MCGLIGYSGPKDVNFSLDKLRLLFMLNQDRGKDSYGYYTPNIGIIKDIGKVETAMIKKDFDIPVSNTFIGHVRASTVGATNKANAHPFNYGNIVLAMNGTLMNTWDLCRAAGFGVNEFDVDSQLLTAILNKEQNKDVLTRILGGCALIYTNTNNGKVYCYRNNDRPLYRGNINGGMYMSSTEDPLKIIGCSNVREFEMDRLYEIYNGVIQNTYKVKRAVVPPVKVNIDPKTDVLTSYKTIFLHQTPSENLIGLYLKYSNYAAARSVKGVTLGFAYECISTSGDNDYEIVILNDYGHAVYVSKFAFEEKIPFIVIGDYVFATNDLAYSTPKSGNFAWKDDLLKVDHKTVDAKGKATYHVTNVVSNAEATLGIKSIRYAYVAEIEEYKIRYGIVENTCCALPEVPKPEMKVVRDQETIERERAAEEDYAAEHAARIIADMESHQKHQSEEDVYKDQVRKTDFETLSQLAGFTVAGVQEIIDDMKEIDDVPSSIAKQIQKLEIITENFDDKGISLNLFEG